MATLTADLNLHLANYSSQLSHHGVYLGPSFFIFILSPACCLCPLDYMLHEYKHHIHFVFIGYLVTGIWGGALLQ